jgi:hypothetical protein
MGCLLSEGDHLYLDHDGAWREAVALMLSEVDGIAERCGAGRVAFRDLPADDREMDRILADRGFAKATLPDSMVLDIDWRTDDEFLSGLKRDFRRHQRKSVLPWEKAYSVEVVARGSRELCDDEWNHLHGLYRNVRERNLALNTFDLPRSFFQQVSHGPEWELLLLRLDPEPVSETAGRPVAFLAAHIGPRHYTPLVVGLDYRWVRSRGLYRRCILECVRRAQIHDSRRVFFGLGAEFEKRRFGATRYQHAIYLRSDDHLQSDMLDQLEADAAVAKERQVRQVEQAGQARSA